MKRTIKIACALSACLFLCVLIAPMPRFSDPLATVTEANDSSLLGARIADDGQWRFPASGVIPYKFEKALLTYEDKWFYYHPGINPVSIVKALSANITEGRIVSGGSTITMQVARIASGNSRTYLNKIIEIFSAVKLELFRSKKKILLLYTANAPFGGNTIGLETAAWRYTGKNAASLSWGEAASLAVLPNSPGLVFPGRNNEILKSKRDNLLYKLFERKLIDTLTLQLALDEPVPGPPGDLPSLAPHLTDHFFKTARGKVSVTTIDPYLQERATEIINNHQTELAANQIFNSACLIVQVKTGNVVAYVGNSSSVDNAGKDVDIIRSPRSTGSILKPFLYAAMQNSGDILPNTLIADIPTKFQGFTPKNFDLGYSGAVAAGQALSQSLNIPAVKMLQMYSQEKFLETLKNAGFTTFNKPAGHYGLSIILGGGETTLWELTGSYASMSRVLNNYLEKGQYFQDYHQPVILKSSSSATTGEPVSSPPLKASAIWLTYEALRKVNRPDVEAGWQYFSSSSNIAWKTGTSYGFRDGWAVGTTPEYVIGVWVGNASGEGRPGLTGISAAAPILFDLVNIMPETKWFNIPTGELTMITVCKESGYRPGPDCPETEDIYVDINGLRSSACPYHRILHLDRTGSKQVTTDCESPDEIINTYWFVLPPAMEYYYKLRHPEYKPVPMMAAGCRSAGDVAVMEFIYPNSGVKLFMPRDQTGNKTKIIAEVAHRNPSKKVFWHLDDTFIATTRSIHQTEITAGQGIHNLTVVDEDGNSVRCRFEVI
ncbi:MAG TPA: penicillin-binding protein 1C [Bacteroidales bacterium]|nr:penicillin-binding protein 1C [Bacteroidales bacterium]